MSHRASLFIWLVLPYVSVTTFVVGHWWRYRRDQFGWTSRSTQLLESRLLAWGSTLFHYGALAVIGGHVAGILIPARATAAVGVSENLYHHVAGIAGGITGIVCLAGFGILVFRRTKIRRIRATTSLADVIVFVLLGCSSSSATPRPSATTSSAPATTTAPPSGPGSAASGSIPTRR